MDTKTTHIHPRAYIVRTSWQLLTPFIFIMSMMAWGSPTDLHAQINEKSSTFNIKRFETIAEIIPFGATTTHSLATTSTSSVQAVEIPHDIFARIPYNIQKRLSHISELIVGNTSVRRNTISASTLPTDIAYIEVPERKEKRLYPVESLEGEDGVIRLSYPVPSISATKRRDLPYQALGSLELIFASTTDDLVAEYDTTMKFIVDVFYTNFYLGVDGSAWQRLAPSVTATALSAHEIINLEQAFETVRLWGRDNEIEPYIMVRIKPIIAEKSLSDIYRTRAIVKQIIPQNIDEYKTSLQITSADTIGKQQFILINTGSTLIRHSGIIPIITSRDYRAQITVETSNTIGTWKKRAQIVTTDTESPHTIRYEKTNDRYIRITVQNMSGDQSLRIIDPVQIIADGILLHIRSTTIQPQDRLYLALDPFFESSTTTIQTFDADTISHEDAQEKINAQIGQPIDNPYVPAWLRDTYRMPQESAGIRLYNQYSPYKETLALGLFALTVILITIRISTLGETKNKK